MVKAELMVVEPLVRVEVVVVFQEQYSRAVSLVIQLQM
jgi:hypothetical protein